MPPRQVLVATYVTFGAAPCSSGMYLVYVAGPELLLVGAASILAGVLYTGGPRPYGYEGLGEVFVFTFFGIVAVTGSYYVHAEALPWEAFVLAVPVGLLAAAILVVNNVRDLETDRRAGQAHARGAARARAHAGALRGDGLRRVPVRSSRWRSRTRPWVLLAWLALPLAVAARRGRVRTHTRRPDAQRALAGTGMLQLVFCVLLSAGILLS